jgi:hypothetical protein
MNNYVYFETGFFKYEDEDAPEIAVPCEPEEKQQRAPESSTALLDPSQWV